MTDDIDKDLNVIRCPRWSGLTFWLRDGALALVSEGIIGWKCRNREERRAFLRARRFTSAQKQRVFTLDQMLSEASIRDIPIKVVPEEVFDDLLWQERSLPPSDPIR